MPLKRTPPCASLQGGDSDVNPSSALTDTENEETSKVSTRHRARKRHHDDEVTVVITELKNTMEAFRNQQVSLQSSINDIQKQNNDIIKAVEFMSSQYDELKDKLVKMETERKTHLAYIQTLELKVENLERIHKQASLEIRNIPIQKTESKEELINLVQKVGKAVDVDVDSKEIRDVFRLTTKKGVASPVIVDFTSVVLKDKILTSVKSHNRAKRDNKLNTGHIGIAGQSKPIFVVECLTQAAKKVYFLAREFSKKNDYAFCWTAHGKIFVRKREGAPPRRIDSQADLDLLLSTPDK
ncbi:intracellular protein transport protein USO1-like [Ostrinia furnacalis]|uniref:intracellular protein transport protein USO1-like n=1 Tax=Ostrinia furnacalis TaxID=93504 RepID=UPI00103AF2EE|nr:intracellular protein transport protein USO1-like [Ostrinia furnacalis]